MNHQFFHPAVLVLFAALAIAPLPAAAGAGGDALEQVRSSGELTWGADAEGGAPYVFLDAIDPSKTIGFEVDIADLIARGLGVRQRHVQNGWESIIPALARGDFSMAMNGIEITPDRKREVLFSIPYYEYSEQLVVRADDTSINGLDDVHGKKIGTLAGAVAMNLLKGMGDVNIRVYSGQAEPYTDLAFGRLDGVLMDLPIAAYYAKPNPKLRYTGEPVGSGFYGIAMRKSDGRLLAEVNAVLRHAMQSGELKAVYEKWGLWDPRQEKLFSDQLLLATEVVTLDDAGKAPLIGFFPALLKGAGVTIVVSTISMLLAISLGLLLALGRVYGARPISYICTAYIELYRGTPLLIQLYILYYGLPNVGLSLKPFTAAILGLGMNYAAYEAEIYRAGLSAVPSGQLEAAFSLGMRQRLALRKIIIPQAFRVSLPAITNDFIALFKDSSLVSVIAMVELTKTYNMLASSTLRFFELGIVAALMYFGMSYPLSLLARRLESRFKRYTER